MSGGGGGGAETTKTEPWGDQEPYLRQLFSRANTLYAQGNNTAYGGQTVAAPGQATQNAQQMALAAANSQGQIGQAAADYSRGVLQGGGAPNATVAGLMAGDTTGQTAAERFAGGLMRMPTMGKVGAVENSALLDPTRNPALQRTAEAATRPLYRQLSEAVLPQIRGESTASGTYGSNRQGIAEGLAAGRTAEAAGDARAKIYDAAYGRGLSAATDIHGQQLSSAGDVYRAQLGGAVSGAQLAQGGWQDRLNAGVTTAGQGTEAAGRALALTGQTQGAQATGASTVGAVGAQKDAYQQALLNQAAQNYYYNQQAPFQRLAQYQQMIQGGYGGSVAASGGGGGASPLMAGAGGAVTGAAMGSMIMPGWGTAIGAGAGGLLGLAGLM